MHVIAICSYEVNIAILIIQNGPANADARQKNVACVQTPPPLSEGRGLLYIGYKKTLAEKKTLIEYHEIMCCIILTLNAII